MAPARICHASEVFGRKKAARPVASAAGEPHQDCIAADMAGLAEAFVTGAAEEGHQFLYATNDGPRLDELVDLFRMSDPSKDVVHSMVLSMGAYVGEVIVRNGNGQWHLGPDTQEPAVQLGTIDCFPLNKVAKRITIGPEHSIAQFVHVALTQQLPPDARRWGQEGH